MSKHTPTPWHACSANDGKCQCQGVMDTHGTTIAHFYGDDSRSIEGVTVQCPNLEEGHANRFRTVACVNALAGIDDPAAFVAAVDAILRGGTMWDVYQGLEPLRLARGEVRR